MFARKPRQRSSRTVVLPSYLIGRFGFGSDQASKMVNGVYVTEEIKRVYRLACGCVVASERECGSSCVFCRLEIEANLQNALMQGQSPFPSPMPTSDEAHFATMFCVRHIHRCAHPFCSRTVCLRHATALPDGRLFCLEHYTQLEDILQLERLGIVKYKVKGFVNSLFFNKESDSE